MTQVPRTVLLRARLQSAQFVQSQKGPVHCLNNQVSQFNGGRTLQGSMNIAVIDGCSAYNKRHGVEFDGVSKPYGCLVDFRPPKVVLKKAAKFGATSTPGVFIGYTQHVGGKWAHDYLACPLEDFQIDNASHTCRIRIQNPRGNS